MERLDVTAPRALRLALAQQPTSQGKVLFAWSLAAGATLARSADASFRDGVLRLEPRSDAWRRELLRARPVLLARMATLLGPDVVRALAVGGAEGTGP